jgi:predicted nucleic-acid-binding Zn-ribbon protein
MKKVNECTQCGWQGNDEQKVDIMQPDDMGLLTCPKCGCGEFYVEPSVKNCTIPDVSLSVCEMCQEYKELQSDNLCKECYDSLPS